MLQDIYAGEEGLSASKYIDPTTSLPSYLSGTGSGISGQLNQLAPQFEPIPTDTGGSTLGLIDQAGSDSGGGGGGVAAPGAAQFSGVNTDLKSKADAANAIFKTLFKGIGEMLTDRGGQIRDSSQLTQDALQRQATAEGDTAASQFAARGLTDSSFKAKSLGAIGDEFSRLSTGETTARDAELAALSQAGEGQRVALEGDQNSVTRALARADDLIASGQTADLTDLQQLRDTIAELVDRLRVDRTQLGTQEGLLGKLDQVAPGQSRFATISQELTNISNSATPSELQNEMIRGLISNDPDLSEEQKEELFGTYLTPVGA